MLGDKKFITVENSSKIPQQWSRTMRTSSTCFGQALQYMRDAYTNKRNMSSGWLALRCLHRADRWVKRGETLSDCAANERECT